MTIPALTSTASELDWLDRNDLPAVMLLRQIDGVDWPIVGTDEEGIGRIGVDHLVNTHHCRSLAYFGGNELASPRLKKGPPLEGVLCHGDNVAYGLLTALREGRIGDVMAAAQ